VSVIRLLVADDNDFFRQTLVAFLNAGGCFCVVEQCADGDEVEMAFERSRPDVVVLDLAMPRLDGLEAARRLLARHPEARVVILTGSRSSAAIDQARRIGVVGYLLKTAQAEHLRNQLCAVAAGGSAWHDG
jgi:DNA-binding NarL/FixJ family response regulator